MASTTFVLKEPNSSEPTLIYMLFRFNNNVLKYSTGQKIHPKFWNSENHRVRETKQFKQYSEFNTFLKNLDDDIHNIYRKLINDNIIPTPDRLRSELKNTSVESQIVKKNDLIGFINDYIKSSVKRPNTLRNYRQTLRVLNDFKPHFKKSLVFENIDLPFYDDFLKYCLEKGYSTNTIGGYVKNIKVFMTEALEKKLTTNIEFRNRKFKTIDEESENIYLNEKEIERIYSFDLSSNTRLDKVRDMFIIGCYTGLRYSDLVLINDNNLIDKNTKLKIKTEKTGERVVIPLHRYIRSILKKYSGIPDYNISNQKMNEYLKELGKLVGINDKVLISTTKGGIKQNVSFKKHELITVHTARRSFATNAYLMNIPPISIMKITGHKTERAFLKYIKISQEDNANKLINHPFFK